MSADSAGAAYGVTFAGGGKGTGDGAGTLFELNGISLTVLHKFCGAVDCADGTNPTGSPVIVDADGDVFGTAMSGGSHASASDGGVVYELIP